MIVITVVGCVNRDIKRKNICAVVPVKNITDSHEIWISFLQQLQIKLAKKESVLNLSSLHSASVERAQLLEGELFVNVRFLRPSGHFDGGRDQEKQITTRKQSSIMSVKSVVDSDTGSAEDMSPANPASATPMGTETDCSQGELCRAHLSNF